MKSLDLRPERSLLKPNFDGYKLSLEPVPVLRNELQEQTRPDRARPGSDQYSCLHAQLYGLQNHLVRDPWNVGSCYFVDVGWTVRWVHYDEASGRLKPVSSVFKLPRSKPRQEGDYNCSLVFVGERLALLADGQGGLRIVETGDRKRGDEWKGRFVWPTVEGLEAGFVLADGRFEVGAGGEKQIHAVCVSIGHEQEGVFETVLHWIKAVQEGGTWRHSSVRVLRGRGFPGYCALEPRSKGLVLASDKSFKFTLDSENPIVVKEEPVPEAKPEAPEDQSSAKVAFEWSQSAEDITIKIPKEDGISYKVTNESLKLKVFRDEVLVIDGETLFAEVDADLTSWTNESSSLQITLFKATTGIAWPFLFPGAPEESNAASRTDEDLPPVSNLTSQLEECDFGIAGQESEYTVERLDMVTHQPTHKTFLGPTAPLFHVSLRPGYPPALALRHDVDACLWMQQPGGPEEWSLRHEGTLHAFGYVQASKQQRKFLSCSPDMGYALICEAERHIFIYKANYGAGATGLRNRSGPQVSIGQQKLVALEASGEILGHCCENDYTILLTEGHVLVLQLRIEE